MYGNKVNNGKTEADGGIQIVGISLIQNEDIFIERVIKNVLEFCDHLIVADNGSVDHTWEIVKELCREYSNVECYRISDTADSHKMIRCYAGTNTWVFGVDGDEIYDPDGLASLKADLRAGIYDEWWQLFGNVLNCIDVNREERRATGFLSPPSRSMTKLYNFNAISSWEGHCIERLHGGEPRFRPGYDTLKRCDLNSRYSWEESPFRCLHTCFLRRSSSENKKSPIRLNIMEKAALGAIRKVPFLSAWYLSKKDGDYKRQKYMRGASVTVNVSKFFGQGG